MFAKLFGGPDDQVLVKLDSAESGSPEVRLFFEPVGLGVCSIALGFEDSEDGWAKAETAFASMNEVEARAGIAAARRDLEAAAGACHP